MSNQMTFKRYEIKYMLTRSQRDALLEEMRGRMALDRYGHSTIRNIYYDTESFRLVRRSLEKPVYKEKLRVRSYRKAHEGDPVFVELKKKYDGVVYKRRLTVPVEDVKPILAGTEQFPQRTQIAREIEYFRDFYDALQPAVFLSYEREAYYDIGGGDFRLTLDENILYRDYAMSLGADCFGSPILRPDQVLMELKTPGAIPLWMTEFLTRNRLYKTSFSKYGRAYQQLTEGKGVLYHVG